MTLYVDRLNGVWQYKEIDDPFFAGHPWHLLAKTNHIDHRDFVVGSGQNNESVKSLGPFRQFSVGQKFEFPPEFSSGDNVWLDMDWLYGHGVDAMLDYKGSPARIGGVIVKESNITDAITVTVEISVPKSKITKK